MIIFWDFNGTILDDKELCLNILNEMLTTHNRNTVTMEQYLDIFTFPVIEYYKQVFDLEKTPYNSLAKEFIEKYQSRSLNCKLADGFKEVHTYFKNKGYKQVVLSASQIDNLNFQLDHFKIKDYFDDVLGINDFYAASKVDVGIKYMVDNNIDKSKALMIGDTIHDFEVAQAMGIDILIYANGHQSKQRLDKFKHVEHLLQIKKRGY